MQNLTFAIWMLLYPLSAAASDYVYEVKLRRRYTDTQKALSALLHLSVWLSVGGLLYSP
jgi:hypothetical protein